MFTKVRRVLQMKVAAIQMCSSHNIDENLAIAGDMIREAAATAKLIVLPEMFAIMGIKPSDKVVAREEIGRGKIQDFLAKTARKNNVWLVGGTIPISCESSEKIKAASIVFNSKGEVVARYDKMHLFDVTISPTEVYRESDSTEPGDSVVVVDTPIGKLGLAVCYDVRFPELFRCLANKGAEIFTLPSAFTVKTGEAHWELLARSRAVENGCYLIGSCQGGRHSSGRETYGHSLIVEPWGTVEKLNNAEPGILYSDIDLEYLHRIRQSIPVLEHQRIKSTDPDAEQVETLVSQQRHGAL
ncbi:MAG: 2-oxoglutaramate amidase [Rickettsiaceae bacterium]|jgi:nitrilase|nr:2-oxoglutaramate amidase [Rickettsiaceae bacterium]